MIRQRTLGSRLYLSALATSFLVWLGGSALAVPVITRTDITPFYSLSEIMTAKRDGGLPTEIHGAPSETAGPAEIAAPLRLPSRVAGGRVLPIAPKPQQPAITRMVLLFNADYLDARTACRRPAETGAHKKGGGLDVFAVLCHGDDYFAQAHLRDNAVSGETDPYYARSIMQLFLALMPSRDEVERDSGDSGRD